MPFGKWGTVAEAAKHYGVTRQSIHKAIHKGCFDDVKLVEMPGGAVWLIPYPFDRRELRNGRPPKVAEEERAD